MVLRFGAALNPIKDGKATKALVSTRGAKAEDCKQILELASEDIVNNFFAFRKHVGLTQQTEIEKLSYDQACNYANVHFLFKTVT
mmetsp:Transcript_12202/g.18833  ORF Transcript_12202/g.18833 Transcript_12202/m.18833 type:complete len:85 (-) Transcript_12202:144-398(-)